MPGRKVGLLLEHVLVLGGLLGVLDLTNALALAASEMYSVLFLRMSRAA